LTEEELKAADEARRRLGRPPLRAASIKPSPKSNDISTMSSTSAKKKAPRESTPPPEKQSTPPPEKTRPKAEIKEVKLSPSEQRSERLKARNKPEEKLEEKLSLKDQLARKKEALKQKR
jgi:hypothetical protein